MSCVTVERGVRVYVQDINAAAPRTIVWIHGWPLMHSTFEYQYNVFPQYGYRCVGVDLRGFGYSDKPWTGYSYDRMADDIGAVLDSLNLNNVTLAGHSMGGAIAIRYMARHKQRRVARLALLAAAAPSFTQRPGFPYGMTREQVDDYISGLYKDRPQVLSDFGKIFFAQPITDSFRQWFLDTGLTAAGYSTIKTLESLRDEDLRADLQTITVPTGIFAGVLDQVCPYAFAVELNRGIAGSKLYRFDNSGHAIYYDELERFNSAFLHFLEG